MRCTACDYPLWNLGTRTCPECGKPFAPSEYEFKPDAVKFCCPHCTQAYYGTAANGHLVPRAFSCVKCGQSIDMDQMVLLPAAGTPEDLTVADAIPWTARRRRLVPAWFRTLLLAMFMPNRLGRLLPPDGGLHGAFTFGLIAQALAPLISIGTLIAFVVVMSAIVGGRGGGGGVGVIFVLLISLMITSMVLLLIWSAAAHAVLRLTGPCKGEFVHTLSTMLYTSAAIVLTAVPCLGPYLFAVSIVWWAVAAGVMLAVVHRVSALRAALAAASIPGMVLAIALGGLIYIFAVTVPQTMQLAQQATQKAVAQAEASSAQGKTKRLAEALVAQHTKGRTLRHPIELVIDRTLAPIDFEVAELPRAQGADVVAGVLLTQITSLSEQARSSLVDRALAEPSDASGARRIGHFVFCERGVLGAPAIDASKLWIVICCAEEGAPRPPASPAPTGPPNPYLPLAPRIPSGDWIVGFADGSTVQVAGYATTAALDEQNALRTGLGLSALPDPTHVRQVIAEEAPVEPAASPPATPPAGG